jgi:hypothetical protein
MEERIREDASDRGPQPEEPAKEKRVEEAVTIPVIGKRRVQKLIKEMWPAYLIEVLVIILGISITLALEEWRDNNKENRLEAIYRKNLLADVEVDLLSLKYATENTLALLDKGKDILEFIKNPLGKSIQPKQLNMDIKAILGRPNFTSSDATFSDIKNSGNLHLLKDISLKSLLFAYYSQAQSIKGQQDAEQMATISISGAYFLKRFPLGEELEQSSITPNEMRELAKNLEFSNNVLLRVTNRNELLECYQKANLLGTQLKSALSTAIAGDGTMLNSR